jgi:hypothetical protein
VSSRASADLPWTPEFSRHVETSTETIGDDLQISVPKFLMQVQATSLGGTATWSFECESLGATAQATLIYRYDTATDHFSITPEAQGMTIK